MDEGCKAMAKELRAQGLTLDECLDLLKGEFPSLSRSTLHRFFCALGVSRLFPRRKDRGGKFKAYKPGFVHIDHFYLPALGGKKRYCFVAIDRQTRLAFLKVYDRKTKEAALDFLSRALEFFPFKVHRLLSDNGPEFTNRRYKRSPSGAKVVHPLDALCANEGIHRRYTKPYTPATNGMAERFVGLCKQATVSRFRYSSHAAIEADLLRWIRTYNLHRPHGGIGRKTPIQQATNGYNENTALFRRDPMKHCQPFLTC